MLNKIYDEKKIERNIPRNIMKELLYLCTKQLILVTVEKFIFK